MEVNRLAKIEELHEGDEILIPLNGNFLYAKIMRKPEISPKKGWQGQTKYKNVKVKCNIKVTKITEPSGYVRTQKEYPYVKGEFNTEKYVDLNYKAIWLLGREYYGNI